MTSTAPGRRRAYGAGPALSLIGLGAHFRGDLASEGAVDVHGTLEGDCQTSAHCFVHEGARVLGNIAAAALVVAGEIEAGLLTAERVAVRSTARVRATIRARVVGIQDGAFFQGQIDKT